MINQIVNFEAEFCGRVPLHQTNMIQPHGALMILDKSDFTILQVSENIRDVFGYGEKALLQSNFLLHIADDADRFKHVIANELQGKIPFVFLADGKSNMSVIEMTDDFIIIEIELRTTRKPRAFVDVFQHVKLAMAAIEKCNSVKETCEVAAVQLRRLSGFDRVMIYKFDESWNGDVIAEDMDAEMESYLGLKFPSSDIPKQARELYKTNPYRLIPNVDYDPVKLMPVLNPKTNAFTNLSNSNLRSVAGVHLEYLRNMRVTASMSTRILIDGALWGLIACHHKQPLYLSYEECSVFELLSNVISAKVATVQKADSYQFRFRKDQMLHTIVQHVMDNGNIHAEKERLANLLDSDGVAITSEGATETFGHTPSKENIAELVMWLQANHIEDIHSDLSLSSTFEPASQYTSEASGMLTLPIEPEKRSFILLFKQEAVKTINWGGNPNEAVQFEADGKKYHPRASFKIWEQTVKNTSMPWRTETIEAAGKFRNFLVEKRRTNKVTLL